MNCRRGPDGQREVVVLPLWLRLRLSSQDTHLSEPSSGISPPEYFVPLNAKPLTGGQLCHFFFILNVVVERYIFIRIPVAPSLAKALQ
jgi:hypothetical protein